MSYLVKGCLSKNHYDIYDNDKIKLENIVKIFESFISEKENPFLVDVLIEGTIFKLKITKMETTPNFVISNSESLIIEGFVKYEKEKIYYNKDKNWFFIRRI